MNGMEFRRGALARVAVLGGPVIRMAVTGRRGYVERGGAVEEASWPEHEPGPGDGHHRPVLGAHHVRRPERVPHDDVLAVDVPVGRDVRGQSAAPWALVHEVTGR